MAVEIELLGNGAWAGGRGELKSYSVDEESTPITANDTSGAVPELRFDVDVNEFDPGQTRLLYDTPIRLTDGSNGTFEATIGSVSVSDGSASITATSPLSALVPEQRMLPYVGTLAGALSAVFDLVGVTTPVSYDPALNATTTQVAMQGWYGSPWEWIKMLCISHSLEVSVIGSAIAIRRGRQREVTSLTDQTFSEDIQRGQAAIAIEVVRYRNEYKANQIVYPAGGWSEDLEVYSVDADEVIEVEIPVDVSIMSIQQPTCVEFVPKNYSGPSVYAVAGNDGLFVKPAQWVANGGKVEVSIGQDTKTIVLKITGPSLQKYAPYSISVNSGTSETYSALRLRGTGVHFERDTLTFRTGADPKIARQDVGVTIDNPTVQSDAQVASLALSAARQFSRPVHTVSATAIVANRDETPGLVRYLTFGEFDAARPDTYKFSSFKTEFAGKTFRQIRDALRAQGAPQDSFANQAFGNVVGSVRRHGDAMFRVRRATITPEGISWEGEASTTFGDVKTAHAGMSFLQLKVLREGMTFAEVSLQPLRARRPVPYGGDTPPPEGEIQGWGLDAWGDSAWGG